MAVIVITAFVWYYALYWLWQWWNWRDISRFFTRAGYGVFDTPFLGFLLLLVAGAEIGALTGLGWARGLPAGFVASAFGGGLWPVLVFYWEFMKTVSTKGYSRELFDCVLKAFGRASVIALSIMPGLVYAASKCPKSWCTWDDLGPDAARWVLVSLLVLITAWALWRSRVGIRAKEWLEVWSRAGSTSNAWARLRARQIIEEVERYERILRILHEHKQELVKKGTSEEEQEEMKVALHDALVATAEEEKNIATILNEDASKISQKLLKSLTVKSREVEKTLTNTHREAQAHTS